MNWIATGAQTFTLQVCMRVLVCDISPQMSFVLRQENTKIQLEEEYVTVEVRNHKLGHTTENVIFALTCRMALKLAVYQALELNSSLQKRHGLQKIITSILNINEGKKWQPGKTTGVYFVKFQAFAPLHPRLQRCSIPSVPSSCVDELTELDIRLSNVCDRPYADPDFPAKKFSSR